MSRRHIGRANTPAAGLAAVHFDQESGNALQRCLASEQQHVVFGMPKIAGGHIQKIKRHQGVALRDVLQTAPFHQSDGGIDDRLGGKAMLGAVLETKDIADQVKGADLAAAVGEEFVAANGTFNNLVDVVGRLGLAVNFGAPVIFEFAQDDRARESWPSSPRAFGLLPGWALTLTNMDIPLFETSFSHPDSLKTGGSKLLIFRQDFLNQNECQESY